MCRSPGSLSASIESDLPKQAESPRVWPTLKNHSSSASQHTCIVWCFSGSCSDRQPNTTHLVILTVKITDFSEFKRCQKHQWQSSKVEGLVLLWKCYLSNQKYRKSPRYTCSVLILCSTSQCSEIHILWIFKNDVSIEKTFSSAFLWIGDGNRAITINPVINQKKTLRSSDSAALSDVAAHYNKLKTAHATILPQSVRLSVQCLVRLFRATTDTWWTRNQL